MIGRVTWGGSRNNPAEGDLVLAAAARLDIAEFRFFEIAHGRWFGSRGGGLAAVERAFLAYMFAGRVPVWATHLARQVLGFAPPPDPALDEEIERPPARIRTGVAASVFVVLVLALVYLAALGGEIPEGCLLPPCY